MFQTALCAALLVGLAFGVPSGKTGKSTEQCPTYMSDYYEDIGCKQEGVDEHGCPTSYDCGNLLERGSEKCHYKGKTLNERQKLENPSTCVPECTCQQSPGPDGTSVLALSCVNIECPELFHGPPRTGCHNTYSADKCCSLKEVCPSELEKSSLEVCESNGKTFHLGEKFYPEDEPCKTCICQKGYNGTNMEPFCQKVKCELELHYGDSISQGCVPIFYGDDGCCPIDWRCPAKTDAVVPAGPSPSTESGKTCKFGSLTMKIGDKLNVGSDRAECSCKVPPHPACVQPKRA